MTFYVENEVEASFSFDAEEVIGTVIRRALESEAFPYENVCVNVLITDNEGIREYNRDYRSIDQATDVLSFPNLEYPAPADYSEIREGDPEVFDPVTGDLVLGDVILNVNRIRSQAAEYGHSEKRETAFLVAHSLLHLLGYDHMEDGERIVMEEKQEAILESLGITRTEG
ncbi:MAG: rRNA maturation RNase YbeY [Lachnospiraceae bacterium]|nr:rRNA maturation RNase YbeY [Lachnospiraceae bacterium]